MSRSSAMLCALGSCFFIFSRLASFEVLYSLSILLACSVLLFLATRSYVIKAYCVMTLTFYLVPGVFQKLEGVSQCSLSCQELAPLAIWLFLLGTFISALSFGKVKFSQFHPQKDQENKLLAGLVLAMTTYDIYALSQGPVGRELLIENGVKNFNSMSESIAFLARCIISIFAMRLFLRTKNTVIALMCLLELSMYFLTTGARSWVVLPFMALAFRLNNLSRSAKWIAGTCGMGLCFYAVVWSTASRSQLRNLGDILSSAILGSTNFYIELERSIGIILTDGPVNQSQLGYTAASYIPRFLWPGKPINEVSQAVTYDAWGVYDLLAGGNVLAGFIGQFLLGEGLYFGFVSMLIIVLLSVKVEVFLRLRKPSPWSEAALVLLVVAILLNGRFFASANLILPIGCLFFVFIRRLRWGS